MKRWLNYAGSGCMMVVALVVAAIFLACIYFAFTMLWLMFGAVFGG